MIKPGEYLGLLNLCVCGGGYVCGGGMCVERGMCMEGLCVWREVRGMEWFLGQ